MSDTVTPDQPPRDAAPVVPPEPKRGRGRPPGPGAERKAIKEEQAKGPVPPPRSAVGKVGRPAAGERELLDAAKSFCGWVGVAVGFMSPLDAAVLEARTDLLAGRLAEVAKTNDALARFLTSAGTGGGWVGLVAELGVLGVAVAANHGAVGTATAAAVMPEYPTVVMNHRAEQAAAEARIQAKHRDRQAAAAL